MFTESSCYGSPSISIFVSSGLYLGTPQKSNLPLQWDSLFLYEIKITHPRQHHGKGSGVKGVNARAKKGTGGGRREEDDRETGM